MSLRSRYSLMLASLLLLAACEDEVVVTEGDDGREASGEVLDGTISDAMIPTDQLRSQPPLLRTMPQVAEGKAEAAEGAEGEAPEGEAPPVEVSAPVEAAPEAAPQD